MSHFLSVKRNVFSFLASTLEVPILHIWRLALQCLYWYCIVLISVLDMIFILTSNVCVPCVYYKNFFLHLQASNFLLLLACGSYKTQELLCARKLKMMIGLHCGLKCWNLLFQFCHWICFHGVSGAGFSKCTVNSDLYFFAKVCFVF